MSVSRGVPPLQIPSPTIRAVRAARRHGERARLTATVGLAVLVLLAFGTTLMIGDTVYGAGEVVRVLLGEVVPGASFTIGELRLPRAVLALLAGICFGVAGVTFQTMLRNPLASPDVIGIGSGAGAAAVFGIVVLGLGPTSVSVLAVAGGLLTAAVVYGLALRDGVHGTRLILMGIGVSAMLDALVAYVLSRAATWDLQTAMRWLTGSVNDASFARMPPLVMAACVGLPILVLLDRRLRLLHLGDDTATALGVPVERTRILVILTAVCLMAFATAASGPITFVSFLAGPIAARVVRPGGSLVVPAGLVGALLVLVADLLGQSAFGTRYPVGIVTGALGAPFLLLLLVRSTRSGAL